MGYTTHDIFVNKVMEENGITKGYAVHEDTIEKDLKILFTNIERATFVILAKSYENGFYTFDRFCQFFVYYQYNNLGWTIIFIDYNNNINAAIKEFEGFKEEDKIKEIFNQIEKYHYLEPARMIIEEY